MASMLQWIPDQVRDDENGWRNVHSPFPKPFRDKEDLIRRGHLRFDLVIEHFGALALRLIAVPAFLGRLVAFA